MGVDKANEWSISYFSAFSINTLAIEPIFSYFNAYVLKKIS